MDTAQHTLSQHWPALVFLAFFVVSRITVRSALKFLDDEAKLKLIDAAGNFVWFYFLMHIPILLIFTGVWAGAVGFVVYVLSGVAFIIFWTGHHGFPGQYRRRVILGHGFLVIGVAVLAAGYFLPLSAN